MLWACLICNRPPPSDQVAKRESCHRYEIHGQTPLCCPTGRKLSTAKYLPEQHETWSISFPDNPKKKQCNKYVNCHFHVFIDKNATTQKSRTYKSLSNLFHLFPLIRFPLKNPSKASALPQTLCRRAFRLKDHTGKKYQAAEESFSFTSRYTLPYSVWTRCIPNATIILPNRFGVTPRMAAG